MPQGLLSGGACLTPPGRHLSIVPSTGSQKTHDPCKLDGQTLQVSLALADEAIRGLELERRHYAELLALLYEGVARQLPYALLLGFARDVARERACVANSN